MIKFVPVAKQDTLRMILSFVAVYDLEMRQLGIKTAFLYGELDEEIYLEQPEGFIADGQENMVCRLHKFLYGLKQASCIWNRHFFIFFVNWASFQVSLIHVSSIFVAIAKELFPI